MNFKKAVTVRDPVCGMWIDPDDAADIELYKENIFYFCAPRCKKEFRENPGQYVFNEPDKYDVDNDDECKK